MINKKSLIGLTFLLSCVSVSAEPSPMNINQDRSIGHHFSGGHSAIAAAAKKKVGLKARDLRLPGSLWCADFANLVRREAGFKTSPSRRAVDQVKNATIVRHPVVGSIMIRPRGRTHVDVVVAVISPDLVVTVGGNVSNSVAERTQRSTGVFALPKAE